MLHENSKVFFIARRIRLERILLIEQCWRFNSILFDWTKYWKVTKLYAECRYLKSTAVTTGTQLGISYLWFMFCSRKMFLFCLQRSLNIEMTFYHIKYCWVLEQSFPFVWFHPTARFRAHLLSFVCLFLFCSLEIQNFWNQNYRWQESIFTLSARVVDIPSKLIHRKCLFPMLVTLLFTMQCIINYLRLLTKLCLYF